MAIYKLNAQADEDLARLYERGVILYGLDAADRYYEQLVDRFCDLAKNPNLWQAVDYIRAGYRRSVFASHSIYYRIEGEDVLIMRILGREDSNTL